MKTLRLLLGDQLNQNHSWFKKTDPQHIYVLMEMEQELNYTTHHIQKIIGFFLAMRSFAGMLENKGHQVIYLKLDEKENQQKLTKNLRNLIEEHNIKRFEYQLPDEYRLDKQLREFCKDLSIETSVFDTEHFLTERNELERFFKGKKQLLMESFYRMMRKKHDVLMDNGEPEGGKWNYDHKNRNKMPKNTQVPSPKTYAKKVNDLVTLLESKGIKSIGSVAQENFIWPTTREEALDLLEYFCKNLLKDFGTYQDALTTKGWSLFHSRLSFALNIKLISPKEIIEAVETYWRNHQETIPLSSAEGFIRQILGWREYMRGIYWMHMPEYSRENYFANNRALPSWFWNGQTKMKCLSHSIQQSLEHAYAHHIQRLMVTGNFALLAGIHPDEVDQWYLGIYIDAIEWVEITNTRGMSQYADGGIVATKPYVSSANYMHKMSHYCEQCHYNYKAKTGEGSCPFNSLYWNFIDQHHTKLSKNPRMSMIYRVWDKNSAKDQNQILEQAALYLDKIEEL
ncbi:cryptochrome/photolyase family protein [Roseivirga pacifica]